MAATKKIDLTRPLNMIYDIAEKIGDLKVTSPSARKALGEVIDELLILQSLLEDIG